MKAATHPLEARRLEALRSYSILDTPREGDYDDIVALAAQICETPIAVINLIDAERQWFKAEVGLGVRETPLETSLCAHAILQPGVFEVPDTLEDNRFADNPLCTGEPHLRFYTGALLESPDGQPLGTLCVLDHVPRKLSDSQIFALRVLARQVMVQMNLRQSLADADILMREMDHRVKNSLSMVGALLDLQSSGAKSPETRTELSVARDRVSAIASLHDQLHRSTQSESVEMSAFLADLVESLRATAGANVTVALVSENMWLKTASASAFGLLVNELVTNALRHGFPEGRAGTVTVSIESRDGGTALGVADDGIGLPEGFSIGERKGLGMRIVTTLANQLGASVEIDRQAKGAGFRLFSPQTA